MEIITKPPRAEPFKAALWGGYQESLGRIHLIPSASSCLPLKTPHGVAKEKGKATPMKREEETGEEIKILFDKKKGSGWEIHLKLTVAAAPVKDQQFATHEFYKGGTLGLRGSCKLKGS